MEALDAKNVHPYKRWVLVKADPRVKKTAGGIHLTENLIGVERVMEGTGEVLQRGGAVLDEDGVKVGDKVCYRGFLKDISRDMIKREDDCDIFFLRVEDIMAVIGPNVTMGVFSSPRET